MKIIAIPDSFKNCLTADEVAKHIFTGITNVIPTANVIKIPISDGGEGLINALKIHKTGQLIKVNTVDPLNRPIQAEIGLINNDKTAVIEMAKSSGIELLKDHERNPLITSTFGTGILIQKALDLNVSKIIIGLGGSATNDGGTGMIKALGGKFLNKFGQEIELGGGALNLLDKIDLDRLDPRIFKTEIIGACDVNNPLTGKNGASYIYGKQKGADLKTIHFLDKNLTKLAIIFKKQFNKEIDKISGSGAAGGMGAAIFGFLNGSLKSGIELMIEQLNLENEFKNCDLIITGEGAIDKQSFNGKAISGICTLAKKHKVPVIAICGSFEGNINDYLNKGLAEIYSINNETYSRHYSFKHAPILIEKTTEKAIEQFLNR